MATFSIPGRLATIVASTGATSTSGAKIAELKTWKLTVASNEIDVTSHDSSNWSEFLTGKRKVTFTADALFLSTNAVQNKIRKALVSTPQTKLAFSFQMTSQSSRRKWTGVGYLLGYDPSAPTEDAALVNLHGVITGALAYTS